MISTKRFAAVCAVCCLAAASALGIAGCSGGQHQIIGMGKSCSACHADKQTYDVASAKNAVESSTNVTVETSADTVLVCSVVFTAEDGSAYVPERRNEINVSGGSATVELNEGYWALCTASGDDVSKAQLVHVSSSGDAATVKL